GRFCTPSDEQNHKRDDGKRNKLRGEESENVIDHGAHNRAACDVCGLGVGARLENEPAQCLDRDEAASHPVGPFEKPAVASRCDSRVGFHRTA
ncbi:MAG TPA: hypothetical protein PKY87_08080, partial [Terricaulis sp.]|nr:hypothetical protein [Terricaulis sp.]